MTMFSPYGATAPVHSGWPMFGGNVLAGASTVFGTEGVA